MLNHNISQKIAESASNTIGYSILITDPDGLVLGASDPSRVGTLHEASLEVVRFAERGSHNEEAAARLIGTRPGMTMPIILNGMVVGTIGISGRPDEVCRYGDLIRTMAEVFLKDLFDLESKRIYELNRHNLLWQLITYDESACDAEVFIERGRTLGMNLELPRAAVVVEPARPAGENRRNGAGATTELPQDPNASGDLALIRRLLCRSQDLFLSVGKGRYAFFIHCEHAGAGAEAARSIEILRGRCRRMQSEAEQSDLRLCIGIGDVTSSPRDLRQSYEDAVKAVKIARRNGMGGCLYINDAYLEKLVLNIPDEVYRRFYDDMLHTLARRPDGAELMEMVVDWCESRFNFTRTAAWLNVHKNTLVYRFNKFRELTGIDLYDFNRTIALYICILQYRMEREN